MAVQIYLRLELKYVLPKLSERPWSLVIFLINENYTASGKEISCICVFQKSVTGTLLSGFNGAYEEIQTKMNTFSVPITTMGRGLFISGMTAYER